MRVRICRGIKKSKEECQLPLRWWLRRRMLTEIAKFDFTAPTNVTDGSGQAHGGNVAPTQSNKKRGWIGCRTTALHHTIPLCQWPRRRTQKELPAFDYATPTNVTARPRHTHGGNVAPTRAKTWNRKRGWIEWRSPTALHHSKPSFFAFTGKLIWGKSEIQFWFQRGNYRRI